MYKRFTADRDGTVALEFALIGTIFFALLLGVVAVGEYFFFQTSLDLGVYRASRDLTVGTAQSVGSGGANLNSFESTYLCPNLLSFFGCSSGTPVTLNMIAVTPENSGPNCTGSSCLTHQSCTKYSTTTPVTCLVETTTLAQQTGGYCEPSQGQVVYLQANSDKASLPFVLPISVVSQSLGSFLSGATFVVEPVPGFSVTGCP